MGDLRPQGSWERGGGEGEGQRAVVSGRKHRGLKGTAGCGRGQPGSWEGPVPLVCVRGSLGQRTNCFRSRKWDQSVLSGSLMGLL